MYCSSASVVKYYPSASLAKCVVIIPPVTVVRHPAEKDIVTLGQGGLWSSLTHSRGEENNTSFFSLHSSSVQELIKR